MSFETESVRRELLVRIAEIAERLNALESQVLELARLTTRLAELALGGKR